MSLSMIPQYERNYLIYRFSFQNHLHTGVTLMQPDNWVFKYKSKKTHSYNFYNSAKASFTAQTKYKYRSQPKTTVAIPSVLNLLTLKNQKVKLALSPLAGGT